MKYYYRKGNNKYVLMLFHGTGGNELDLLPLAEAIDIDATIISFRGDVDEYGNLRFFKRYANGMFDQEDLKVRTEQISKLIFDLADEHGFAVNDIVLIGYSNGANMISSLLFAKQINVKGAILMHPMVARRDVYPTDLTKTKILITAGVNDPICPVGETKLLAEIFKNGHAEVSVEWFEFGHRLTEREISSAAKWYQNIIRKSN